MSGRSQSDAAEPKSAASGCTDLWINGFVDELVVALMNAKIYWPEHPRVAASITEIVRQLREWGTGETTTASSAPHATATSIEIHIVDGQLVHQQRQLLGASLSAPRLIEAILGCGAGGLGFAQDTSEADVRELLRTLIAKPRQRGTASAPATPVTIDRCERIRLLPSAHTGQAQAIQAGAQMPVQVYQALVGLLQDTTIGLCHGGTIAFDRSQACVESVMRSLLGPDPGGLMRAVRYERYDAYTFGHSIRVAVLALEFARTMTDDPDLLNRIGVAALLHDVGKVRVPFEVLHCQTRLDAEQRREMERHPEYGAEILMDHQDCDPMAYGAAFGHHLGPDSGRGYPKALRQPEVSLATRIVKICDVFEALTAERPYKAGMSPLRAYRIMIGMGDMFDAALLKRFIRTIGLYPVGSSVELTSGQRARVLRQSLDLERPVLQLETTVEGDTLSVEDRQIIDLSDRTAAHGGCLGCEIAALLDQGSVAV